jgi:hypothetical protein
VKLNLEEGRTIWGRAVSMAFFEGGNKFDFEGWVRID